MKVYHYTTLDRARKIIRCGYILPPILQWAPDDAPIAWFSRSPEWEPTASHFARAGDGKSRAMTFPEMAAAGVARFAAESCLLLRWKDLQCLAPMIPETTAGHERFARKRGSDIRHWFGSPTPVPIYDIRSIEVFDVAKNHWRDFGYEDMLESRHDS